MKTPIRLILLSLAAATGLILANCRTLDNSPLSSDSFYDRLPENTLAAGHLDLKTTTQSYKKGLQLLSRDAAEKIITASATFRGQVCDLFEKNHLDASLLRHAETYRFYYAAIPLAEPVVMKNAAGMEILAKREKLIGERMAEHIDQPDETKADNISEEDIFEEDGLPVIPADTINRYTIGNYLVIDTDSPQLVASALLDGIRKLERKHSTGDKLTVTPATDGRTTWYELYSGTFQRADIPGEKIYIFDGPALPVFSLCAYGRYLILSEFDPQPILKVLDGCGEDSFSDHDFAENLSESYASFAINVKPALGKLRDELKASAFPNDPNNFELSMRAAIARQFYSAYNTTEKAFGLNTLKGISVTFPAFPDQPLKSESIATLAFDGAPEAGMKAFLDNNIRLNPPRELSTDNWQISMWAIDFAALHKSIVSKLSAEHKSGYDLANGAIQKSQGLTIEKIVGLFTGEIYIASGTPKFQIKTPEDFTKLKIRYYIGVKDQEKVYKLLSSMGGEWLKEGDAYYLKVTAENEVFHVVLTPRHLIMNIGEDMNDILHPAPVPAEKQFGSIAAKYPKANLISYCSSEFMQTLVLTTADLYKTMLKDLRKNLEKRKFESNEKDFKQLAENGLDYVEVLVSQLKIIAGELPKFKSSGVLGVGQMEGDNYVFRTTGTLEKK